MTTPLTLSLYRIDNNRRFARIMHQPPREHRWARVQEMVAQEFDCDVDAVGELETDDGVLLTVAGIPVARQSLEGSEFRTTTTSKPFATAAE